MVLYKLEDNVDRTATDMTLYRERRCDYLEKLYLSCRPTLLLDFILFYFILSWFNLPYMGVQMFLCPVVKLEHTLSKMKHSPNAEQLRGAEVVKGRLNRTSRSLQAANMIIARNPNPMGLSDMLDSTSDNLNGQNGNSSGLLGNNVKQGNETTREFKLAECLKELASFQRSVLEDPQEDYPMQPKDLNTLFSAGIIQSKRVENADALSAEAKGTVSEDLGKAGCNVGAVKSTRRREVKAIQQKPWSFSTKTSVRQLKGDAGVGKIERLIRMSKKSPVVGAKSRQYVIHSNPLATGRRLSTASSKRRDSLELSPTKCKRMSNSPTLKPKSAEKKKYGFGIQAANAGNRKTCSNKEQMPTLKGGKAENKALKHTDRQKVILKRVMSSPVNGKKKVLRETASGLMSSVDLSAAARRARRLSQVLRSEHELKHHNQQYAKEAQQLRQQLAIKEDEVILRTLFVPFNKFPNCTPCGKKTPIHVTSSMEIARDTSSPSFWKTCHFCYL